jgi:excinuclease ABC subunit A
MDEIRVTKARIHNLKNIDIAFPRHSLTVITGPSGSGKSSLAFDTIYAEGQRRYIESLSSYARQFIGQMEAPEVESITGLSPSIAIDQKSTTKNPRSTVGTITEIYDYLRLLYARLGVAHCPETGERVSQQSPQQIVNAVLKLKQG